MKKEDILNALEQLGAELTKKGIQGEVLLVGGAAMCLAHNARDATKDVDALFEPKAEMYQAIERVAKNNNLEIDWMNDSVKGFIHANPKSLPFIEYPGIKISTVSPEYLLAMKMYSARTGLHDKDIDDIKSLVNILELKAPDDAYRILDQYFPKERILPRTQYLIEEIFMDRGSIMERLARVKDNGDKDSKREKPYNDNNIVI